VGLVGFWLDHVFADPTCTCAQLHKVKDTVNLEILAAKIFSVSRSIDIWANLNFSDLVLGKYFSSNFIIIVMVGSSLLVYCICLFYFLVSSRGGRSGEFSYYSANER